MTLISSSPGTEECFSKEHSLVSSTCFGIVQIQDSSLNQHVSNQEDLQNNFISTNKVNRIKVHNGSKFSSDM